MTKKLVDHLARSSSSSLTPLLGDTTVELIGKIGNDAMTQQGLAFLIVSMRGEEGALRCPLIRTQLVSNLSNDEAKSLCDLLQLPSMAPSLTLSGVDFESNLSNFDVLMRWFDVPNDFTDAASVESSRKAVASQQLRAHQLAAFRNLRRAIGGLAASTLVHMPMGAGKLRLVATAVLDLYRSESEGHVIVWLTPGDALCEEAFIELNNVWERLGSHDVTVYRLYGSHSDPDLGGLTNCIVVADVTKIKPNNKGLIDLGEKSRVVVLGDAGHVVHPAGAAIIETMSKKKKLNLVGVSASPSEPLDSSAQGRSIKEKFPDSYISMGEDAGRLLLEAGEVREVDAEVYRGRWEEVLDYDGDDLEPSDEFIEKLSRHVGRNQELLELLCKKSQTQGRVVFFAATADHARLFSGLLGIRGVRAMPVTSQKSVEDRARVIEKFKARDVKVLCVHGFFVSGDSIPDISVAVIAAPTLSESVLRGMIGRLASGYRAQSDPIEIVVLSDSIPNTVIRL